MNKKNPRNISKVFRIDRETSDRLDTYCRYKGKTTGKGIYDLVCDGIYPKNPAISEIFSSFHRSGSEKRIGEHCLLLLDTLANAVPSWRNEYNRDIVQYILGYSADTQPVTSDILQDLLTELRIWLRDIETAVYYDGRVNILTYDSMVWLLDKYISSVDKGENPSAKCLLMWISHSWDFIYERPETYALLAECVKYSDFSGLSIAEGRFLDMLMKVDKYYDTEYDTGYRGYWDNLLSLIKRIQV